MKSNAASPTQTLVYLSGGPEPAIIGPGFPDW